MDDQSGRPKESAVPGLLPEIGAIVDTVAHGRQQVMDVLGLPNEEKTVYLRPERGGREWTVPLSRLTQVIVP